MTEIIKLNNVSKIYNKGKENQVTAIDGINLSIAKGETVAIMGVSGSGKSTLLNILGAMDTLTYGEYFFNGKRVDTMNADELAKFRGNNIGFVLQSYGLLPNEKVITNVEMPLYFSAKSSSKVVRDKALTILKKLGIDHLANRKVKQLSGGQKQRVAIARAIVKDPELVLADEPTGALDSNTANEIMKIFEELNADGTTIIMVTHDLSMATYMSRIINIKDGKITE